MTRKVTSYRLPEMTLEQIKKLTESTGSSDANVIAFAIDRMYQQEVLQHVKVARPQSGEGIKMTVPAYVVNATTEYNNGDIYAQAPRHFTTREQAVAHAEHLTGTTENNGIFAGEWVRNWQVSFFEEGEVPSQLRITAHVEPVTNEEILKNFRDSLRSKE